MTKQYDDDKRFILLSKRIDVLEGTLRVLLANVSSSECQDLNEIDSAMTDAKHILETFPNDKGE